MASSNNIRPNIKRFKSTDSPGGGLTAEENVDSIHWERAYSNQNTLHIPSSKVRSTNAAQEGEDKTKESTATGPQKRTEQAKGPVATGRPNIYRFKSTDSPGGGLTSELNLDSSEWEKAYLDREKLKLPAVKQAPSNPPPEINEPVQAEL
jgi:hypothetical protein